MIQMPRDLPDMQAQLADKLLEIKGRFDALPMVEANLVFKYNFYKYLYYPKDIDLLNNVVGTCIVAYVNQPKFLTRLKVITSTYEVCTMLPLQELVLVGSGKSSNMIDLEQDAAKLGLLCAIRYKEMGIGLFESINLLLA